MSGCLIRWRAQKTGPAMRAHRASAVAVQSVAAAIPVAAVIEPHNSLIPAILGAVIIVLSGTRATFHWQENYLRFSRAREAIEAERRLYKIGGPPYSEMNTKDTILATRITKIERDEMSSWFDVAAKEQDSNKTRLSTVVMRNDEQFASRLYELLSDRRPKQRELYKQAT